MNGGQRPWERNWTKEESEAYRKSFVESEKQMESLFQRQYYMYQTHYRKLYIRLVYKIILFLIAILLVIGGYVVFEYYQSAAGILFSIIGGGLTIYCLTTWREFIDSKRSLEKKLARKLDDLERTQQLRKYGEDDWNKNSK